LLHRDISCNSVNFKNPGHSAPHGLIPPLPLTEAFQAAGGRENAPEDDFCRPGSVQSATPSPDWQNLPIYNRSIWLFHQFLAICVTFSPTNCGSMTVSVKFLEKTRFYRLYLAVACANSCSPPVRALNCTSDFPLAPRFPETHPQQPRVSKFSHS